MSPQLAITFILAAIVSLAVGTWEVMRNQAPALTVASLNATAESTATGLLTSGTIPAVGASWNVTDAAGDKITYTVVASSTTSITLQAKSGTLTAQAGAHTQ
jgi:hypothetical protein